MSDQKEIAALPNQPNNAELSPIPDKIYFSIGEVATLCQLKPHVLRYWEQEFSELSPSKRRGNRRYYQRKEVLLVRQIKHLLYDKGYTIDGARSQLSGDEGVLQRQMQQAQARLQSTLSQLEKIAAELEEV